MRRAPRGYDAGPLAWAGVIATTCLLLFLFQKILWLVVPFLFALITFYLLYPLKQRLVLAGVSHDAAAIVVTAGVCALLAVLLTYLAPGIAPRVSGWQSEAGRYLDGGLRLLAQTLAWAEANIAFAARARLSESVYTQVALLMEAWSGRYLASAAMTAAAWFPSLLLVPFLAFFFLRDGWRLRKYLCHAVPNAYFERTLFLIDEIDRTAQSYFHGLARLTVLDAVCLGAGLWLLGVSAPWLLGVVTAILAWVPYVGSIAGCLLVVLVAATDFPSDPAVAYGAIALFLFVRLLDDFVFMPLTIGRSLRLHPLLTVLMIFAGGAVAGIAGLVLVLPLLGVIMVLGHSLGALLADPRLSARHRHARALREAVVTADLRGGG